MSKKSRRARHTTATADTQQSILDRYRLLLIGVVIVVSVGVMGCGAVIGDRHCVHV